jgi:SseB protein N-terminal domain
MGALAGARSGLTGTQNAVRGKSDTSSPNARTTVFKPENSLEALMQAAGKDPGAVPAFYQALLETEIYVLAPETPMRPGRRRSLKFQEKINIATVEFQGMKWHPAFTSKKRISDYVKEPETCLGAAARNLFEMLPNSNFWLNPLSECQKPLLASEIDLLMNGEIFEALKRTR